MLCDNSEEGLGVVAGRMFKREGCICICMCMCMCMCIYVCVCVYVYVCMCICIHMYIADSHCCAAKNGTIL